jgi:steroid delta-isomerase-like uncharacterized protein
LGLEPAQSLHAAAPEQEQNKAIARRVFEEIFNQGKFEVANQIYAPDFINHGLHRDASLAEDQAAAQWEKQALPDLRMSVQMMVAERDLVTVLWLARGTNTHAAGWLPATGAKVELRGVTIWRIASGKIHEEWSAFDMLRVVRQFVAQLWWKAAGLLIASIVFLGLLIRTTRKTLRRRVPEPDRALT